MQYPIVYDKFETAFTSNGLAVLENASNVLIKEVINGEYLLSFILPRNDPKWQHIQSENFVKVDSQLFRVRGLDEQRDSTGKLTSNVQCEHVFYDTQDCKFFPEVELIGQTPLQILQYAFAGTRFTLGTVEITTPTDILLPKVYPKQIIDKLIENVGGELIKNNWIISLVSKRGNNTNAQLRYGKNQVSLKKSTDAKGVITRLYPYGKDSLQIAGSLGYIDSPLINNYDRPKVGYLDYKDIEDQAELLAAGQAEWSNENQDGIDKPKVTYSGEWIELKKLKEYGNIEAFSIGDTVRVIDEGLGVNTLQRILEYSYYPYEAKRSTVTLSNVKPSVYKDNRPANVIGNTITNSNYVDSIKDSSNKLDPGWFQNIKTKLKTLFNGGLKDAVMHKTGDIWVDNPDNPTKAMGILADGFAIANSKTASGDWNWKTFGTADGFTADEIVAGILKGIQIQQISDAGTLLMEVFKDVYGGKVHIYDNDGNINVRLGVESPGGQNVGGTLRLFNDSLLKARVALGTYGAYDSGFIILYGPNNTGTVYITANQNNEPSMFLYDSSGNLKSKFTASEITVNNQNVATENWVASLLSGFASRGNHTGSDGHSHSVTINGQTYQTTINSHDHLQT